MKTYSSSPHRKKSEQTTLKIGEISQVLVYVVPVVFSVVCYVNGWPGQFVHDDLFAISQNYDVTGKRPIRDVFRNDFWGKPMEETSSHKSYRPLCVLTFRFDYAVSGGDPRWFHVVNTLLHACVSLMLTHVCLTVVHTTPLCASLAAALFAVHPIHTEAVTGIVGRADVLAAFFFLLSFLLYSRSMKEKVKVHTDINGNVVQASTSSSSTTFLLSPTQLVYLTASLGVAAVAMLCKESGVTVLGLCVLYDTLVNKADVLRCVQTRRLPLKLLPCLLRCVAVFITAAILMYLRLWMMNFQQPVFFEMDNPASFSTSWLTRTLTYLYLPPFNLWLLVCPTTLSYDWGGTSIPLVQSLTDHRLVFILIFYTILVGAGWTWLRYSPTDTGSPNEKSNVSDNTNVQGLTPLVSLGLLCLPFLPASNLFFHVGFVAAERVLYMPSLGYCLLVSCGVLTLCGRVPRLKVSTLALFGLLVLAMAARTLDRNTVWLSRRNLFSSGIRDLPNNPKIQYNMANLLKDERDKEGAELHYREAIKLYPRHPSYHTNLGTILNNLTEAKMCYMEAQRIEPRHVGSLVNLGILLLEEGDQSAQAMIEKALDIDPHHTEAMMAMGKILMKAREYDQAEELFRKALMARPDLPMGHLMYAIYCHNTGDLVCALHHYIKAAQLDPNQLAALTNAGRILMADGKYSQALDFFKRAVSVNQSCSECLRLLGNTHAKMGFHKDAVITLAQAASLAPNNTEISLRYVQALKEAGQNGKAVEAVNEILSRVSQDLVVLRFAFNLAMELNRLDDALQHIQEAITVAEKSGDPKLDDFYWDLAELSRHREEYDKALEFYGRCAERNHRKVESIVSIGSLHYLKNDFAAAESNYLRALSLDPENRLATINLRKLKSIYEGSKHSDVNGVS